MEDVLDCRSGTQVVKPIYVERSTLRRIVIISNMNKEKFFVKCTALWQNDAVYTEAIARMAPHFFPKPLAVDACKQVMISKRLRGNS